MSYNELYNELETIGRGNYGSAVLVTQSGKKFVAKKIPVSAMSSRDRQSSIQEANVLKSLSHPGIVSFKESFLEKDTLIIIMEYCAGGDLSQLIKSHKESGLKFPESTILSWLVQLAGAMHYIHSRKILHRDVKSSNIYLTEDGQLKVGDFGIAKVLEYTQANANSSVGTPYYLSPEICMNMPYSYKSDVWSLGVIIYELCALNYPFTARSLIELVLNITSKQYLPLSQDYSLELRELVDGMLVKDVSSRITLGKVLKSPFLRSISKLKVTLPRRKKSPAPQVFDLAESVELSRNTLSSMNPLDIAEDDLMYSVTNLKTISDQSYSDSFEDDYSDDFESDDPPEQVYSLREKAIELIGKDMFRKIYVMVRQLRMLNKTDDVIQENIAEMLGEEAAENMHVVDQVIYFEENYSK